MDETTGPGPSGLDPSGLRAARDAYERTEVSALEGTLFGHVGERIRTRGHLLKDDLDDIARWRARRASGFVARNDPDEVVEISTLAFAESTSDRVRLKLLTLLDGISERTASSILAIWDPERYAAWDERIAEVLRGAELMHDATLPAMWSGYLDCVRSLGEESGLGMRDVEKALYALGTTHANRVSHAEAGGDRPPDRRSGRQARGSVTAVGAPPEARGDPNDEAGRALMRMVREHMGEDRRDAATIIERAERTLRLTTPEERRLLLALHRRLLDLGLYVKTSRDLGWNYYANDVGKGLVGEVALRVPRGRRDVHLVAYIPVEVSAGANRAWFETASQTQQKGQIPPAAVDSGALVECYEKAAHLQYLRA